MATKTPLKAPFPYFGGKSKVADMVWDRIGNVDNFVEPFAGSLAVLLRRPEVGKIETVNDRNHFIANFWRAVQADPIAVAKHADSPVSEADLHARHSWLMDGVHGRIVTPIARDPEWFCPKIAGWWVWGQCCWIGGGWCDDFGTKSDGGRWESSPLLGQLGKGVNNQSKQVPNLGDAYDIGRGVNSNGSAGTCEERRKWLEAWIQRLADRLRLVRVCYGTWNRICDSKTTMDRLGTTGAFLDPPYAKNIARVQALIRGEEVGEADSTNRANELYAGDKTQDIDQLVADVNLWCQRWGAKDTVRIALCGYEGEHDNLVELGWSVEAWKAHGGYGNRNADNQNKTRERIWFSPACIQEPSLF